MNKITEQVIKDMEADLELAKKMSELESAAEVLRLAGNFNEYADRLKEASIEMEFKAKRWNEKAKTAQEWMRLCKQRAKDLSELMK